MLNFKKVLLTILLITGLSHTVTSWEPGDFLLNVKPTFFIPLEYQIEADNQNGRYSIGGGAMIKGQYFLPFSSFLSIGGFIDYTLLPTTFNETLNVISFGTLLGLEIPLSRKLFINVDGGGGYYYGIQEQNSGGNFFIQGSLGMSFFLNNTFSLYLGGGYKYAFSGDYPLYEGIHASLGLSYNFSARAKKPELLIDDILFDPVFPVFYTYYDTNPLGSIKIKNTENGTINNVKVSFFIKQYMDQPKESFYIAKIDKDEELTIPLYALFNRQVLDITENTKSFGDIVVEYEYQDNELVIEKNETIRINNKNAMTWDDDRKAAAFVTALDPTILKLSRNIAGLIRNDENKAVNLNFRIAMGLFQALQEYNVNYVIDPGTPYEEFSENTMSIDFLQFPKQTLEFKAGDCDDLSILFCALLESAGIKTAFVTVPGHIYMAFSLGVSPEKAKSLFNDSDMIIIKDKEAWFPVEITLIQNGFLRAWQSGAKQWNENNEMGLAMLYPIQNAWQLYEPVGFSADEALISIPDDRVILASYHEEISRLINWDLSPQVRELEKRIESENNPKRHINRLGVLYSRYGLFDKALEQFDNLVETWTDVSALTNKGNIYLIRRDFKTALDYYLQAYELKPENSAILVGLMNSYYQLGDLESAKKHFEKLREINVNTAEKYSYLISQESSVARASDIDAISLEWAEE
ncbi:MAG: tetratricopeptide repeat protein [Spirochaetaceae bacterium]|nr:tetratricopeptide repeat protein [Spirochaetaceae bacterium]